ncbi:MAG: mevalonate kinase [Deltaproteobacteria bacterium]|nr:mevalonate kinase [Deltaproteobacteria bacterium]
MSDQRFSVFAPGKTILFGEHFVVRGGQALAVPVSELGTTGKVSPAAELSFCCAADVAFVKRAFFTVCEAIGMAPPAIELDLETTLPIGAGLGSSASLAVALAEIALRLAERRPSEEEINQLAYRLEQLAHGAPSGVDNTVIAYRQPIVFKSRKEIRSLNLSAPLQLLIADTGVQASTAAVVAGVAQRATANSAWFADLLGQADALVDQAALALENAELERLGRLLNANHRLLVELGVSSSELDRLVEAALAAGAKGAKMTGAGAGGCMIALVDSEAGRSVGAALKAAGAVRLWSTQVDAVDPRGAQR